MPKWPFALASAASGARVLGLWIACGCFGDAVRTQQPQQSQPQPQQTEQQQPAQAPQFTAAVDAWLESDTGNQVLLERATAGILNDETAGLAWLGGRLREPPAGNERAQKRLRDLGTDVLLGVIEDRRKSDMVFRGQYQALRALEPFATQRLFELLLQSPDWFDSRRRIHLVPAIADLQLQPPAPPVLLGITDVIADADREPDDLRRSLSCLVWQWGRKEHVQARAASLREASAEGDAEDRVFALRQLADLWYRVQEYPKAANTHAAMTALATKGKLTLSPTDWYWGACYEALCGHVDAGLDALSHCADLLASPSTDSSLRLPRRLFERDPEIAPLRADPRFRAIVEHAFGGGERSEGR